MCAEGRLEAWNLRSSKGNYDSLTTEDQVYSFEIKKENKKTWSRSMQTEVEIEMKEQAVQVEQEKQIEEKNKLPILSIEIV